MRPHTSPNLDSCQGSGREGPDVSTITTRAIDLQDCLRKLCHCGLKVRKRKDMSLRARYTLEKVSNSSQGQHTKTNNHSHSQAVLSESSRTRSVPGIFCRERVRVWCGFLREERRALGFRWLDSCSSGDQEDWYRTGWWRWWGCAEE